MPRKALSFMGRVGLLVALLFGPMATVIVGVLVGLPEGVGRGLLLISMIWVMSALVLTPAILFPPSGHSPGPPGGGGGGGDDPPDPPDPPPSAPRGGVPLPDAEQSRVRVRDHARPGRRRVPLRRPARESERRPAPAP